MGWGLGSPMGSRCRKLWAGDWVRRYTDLLFFCDACINTPTYLLTYLLTYLSLTRLLSGASNIYYCSDEDFAFGVTNNQVKWGRRRRGGGDRRQRQRSGFLFDAGRPVAAGEFTQIAGA